jgi:hypothetical protein
VEERQNDSFVKRHVFLPFFLRQLLLILRFLSFLRLAVPFRKQQQFALIITVN